MLINKYSKLVTWFEGVYLEEGLHFLQLDAFIITLTLASFSGLPALCFKELGISDVYRLGCGRLRPRGKSNPVPFGWESTASPLDNGKVIAHSLKPV